MIRKSFNSNGRKLSYLDYMGNGSTLITLHGHLGCATMYSKLAKELSNNFRVISLDQQGHGFSDWGVNYTRDEYVNDINNLYIELGIDSAIIVAHSLGAVNAYQFSAKYPNKISALVIEDIGVRVNDDLSFLLEWPNRFDSLRSAYNFLLSKGINNFLYFMESLIPKNDGWVFRFDKDGLVKSQQNLNGNWLSDWLQLSCRTLLMNGTNSDVLDAKQALDISNLNKNVTLKTFKSCGHSIKDDNYSAYEIAIKNFLNQSKQN